MSTNTPVPFAVDQGRFERLHAELNEALSATPTSELQAWAKDLPGQFGRRSWNRVDNLRDTVATVCRSVLRESGDAIEAGQRGDFNEYVAQRRKTLSEGVGTAWNQTRQWFETISSAARSEPNERLPQLAGAVFGFVLGSGGLDGDGGAPDLDLLVGIGAHRSILTHSILMGAAAETLLMGTAQLARIIYPNLPAHHDPLWEDLLNQSEPVMRALAAGVSTGISYHLAIDATVDSGGTYNDIPVSMPEEGHAAVASVNAAAEGNHAARSSHNRAVADSSSELWFPDFKEASSVAKANPGSRVKRAPSGGFFVYF